MHVPPSIQSVYLFVFDPKWAAVNNFKLSLDFNFAARHTSGHTEIATRSYDVTMI